MAIDIGAPAIARGFSLPPVQTRINKENPANASGTITSVEIWSKTDLSGVKVGIFYTTNGDTLKCRSAVTIGNVTSGSKQTFGGLSLAVMAGDYIGMYWSGGLGWYHTAGYTGIWSIAGDHCIVDDEADYALGSGDAFSLYGTGVEAAVAAAGSSMAAKMIAAGALESCSK